MPGAARADRRRPAQRALPRAPTLEGRGVSAARLRAPRAPRGARAARGARARARRRAAARRARRRPPDPRAGARPARLPARRATCSSSTPRPRCPPRCRARARRRRRARAAPLDAAARRRRRPLGRRAARRRRSASAAGAPASVLALPGGGRATLDAPLPPGRAPLGRAPASCPSRCSSLPRPPRRADPLPLRPRRAGRSTAYQTVYATEPGSAEMPSAGRPFTPARAHRAGGARRRGRAARPAHRRLVARARRAPVPRVLPRAAGDRAARRGHARLGRARRSRSGRRSCARSRPSRAPTARVEARGGLDRRSSSPRSAACAIVDGLLTGWHEPEASHLRLLEAIAGRPLVERSYARRAAGRLPLARVRRRPPDPAVGRAAPRASRSGRLGVAGRSRPAARRRSSLLPTPTRAVVAAERRSTWPSTSLSASGRPAVTATLPHSSWASSCALRGARRSGRGSLRARRSCMTKRSSMSARWSSIGSPWPGSTTSTSIARVGAQRGQVGDERLGALAGARRRRAAAR